MIVCPNCGEIPREGVLLYDGSWKKQNIRILPVHPRCAVCGAEAQVDAGECSVTAITGTCGSGKTTVAEELSDRGYLPLDGDPAIEVLRRRTGRKKYEWAELTEEVLRECDVLSAFGRNIVLSHVILPGDLDKYVEHFRSRGMKFKLILLRPELDTALARCQTRTCFSSVTPPEIVRQFYDALRFDGAVEEIDNGALSPGETADRIERLSWQK